MFFTAPLSQRSGLALSHPRVDIGSAVSIQALRARWAGIRPCIRNCSTG